MAIPYVIIRHSKHKLYKAVPAGQGQGPSESPSAPPTAPKPSAPVGNPEVRRMATDYVRQAGVAQHLPEIGYPKLPPEEVQKKIADTYEAAPHDPNDPEVANSYAKLAHETKQQYLHAQQNGYTFTPWGGKDPYKTSAEMRQDVLNNKNLGYYQGGDMPQDHPLAQVDPETGLTPNDMFRAVHDLYGHALHGFEFGPRGEYGAWKAHSQMYSPEARRAMTSETHSQNSFVNFGKHLRRPDGSIPKRGEEGWIHPNDRPFAEQKAVLPPNWVMNT